MPTAAFPGVGEERCSYRIDLVLTERVRPPNNLQGVPRGKQRRIVVGPDQRIPVGVIQAELVGLINASRARNAMPIGVALTSGAKAGLDVVANAGLVVGNRNEQRALGAVLRRRRNGTCNVSQLGFLLLGRQIAIGVAAREYPDRGVDALIVRPLRLARKRERRAGYKSSDEDAEGG